MTPQRYRRHDRPGVRYVAWQVGGMMDPYPDWVCDLLKDARMREDDFFGLSVLTITGDWRRVSQGDWVVLQEARPSCLLWEMDTEAFTNNFYEVQ